jgi:hypothetical protein
VNEDETAILGRFKKSGRWEYQARAFGNTLIGPEILAMTQDEKDSMVRMIQYGWKMLEDHSWFKANRRGK